MSIFQDIDNMYEHYGFPRKNPPSLLSEDDMDGRVQFLLEEVQETILAHEAHDLPETIDGLIDIIVVAAGTLSLMGVNGQLHWEEVLRANMSKEVGPKPGRNLQYDLFKPADWQPPDHERVLETYVDKTDYLR